ncbi:hypothetical protein TSUD_139420 [Trifolium subterraneum]|uniref:Reverse transcriptase zinc-binding domain-containing protein n=1 Tax=Trifolium subterraneum TaxID=3900 RepID=A0A2Z6PGM1_TRISU|nr:hypothetical protein TSUD_139420 [Trifolium subterraneum]
MSGLKVNFNKSMLVGVNIPESWLGEVVSVLRRKVGKVPFLYLGLPIGGDPRRLGFWEAVLARLKNRLSWWKSRFLSFGGHLIQFKSVLTSLSVYAFSVFKSLSVVLEARYGVERGWLRVGGQRGSSCWKEIVSIKDSGRGVGGEWFGEHVSKKVGDGSDTFFWTNPWVDGTPLCVRFGRPFDFAETKSCLVDEMASLGWHILQIYGNGSLTLLKATLFAVPLKVSIFAWRLLRDRLPIKANLHFQFSLATCLFLDWIFFGGFSYYIRSLCPVYLFSRRPFLSAPLFYAAHLTSLRLGCLAREKPYIVRMLSKLITSHV